MRAAEYLGQLRQQNEFYIGLAEVTKLFINGNVRSTGAGEAIAEYRSEARSVASRLGLSLSDGQLEQIAAALQARAQGIASTADFAVRHHSSFLSRFETGKRTQLESEYDLAVGVLQSADFNASAIPVPGAPKSWVLAFNEGLSVYLYHYARILFSVPTLTSSSGETTYPPTLSQETARELLAQLTESYSFLGIPLVDDWESSPMAMQIASLVSSMGEQFVYCHEIGHILLGHDAGGPLSVLANDVVEVEEADFDEERELEADLMAWSLLINVLLPTNAVIEGNRIQEAVGGIVLFLSAASDLEVHGHPAGAHTHPPASERLEQIRLAVRLTAEEMAVPPKRLMALEEMIHGRVADLTLPGLRPPRSPLDDILAPATAHPFASMEAVQARGNARNKILRLLSLGAPGRLCRELGERMARAQIELERLGFDMESADEGAPALDELDSEALHRVHENFGAFMVIGGVAEGYAGNEIAALIDRKRRLYLKTNPS